MKIGIITHHYIINYGAFLQVYALQEYLRENLSDVEVLIVNYINRKHKIINIGGCFRFFLGRENLRSYFEKIKLPFTFNGVEKKYLNLTKRVNSAVEINKLGLDCIIIGSDEVWHYESNARDPIKFSIGLKADRIISYAPSAGSVDLKNPIPDFVKKGLFNFTSISVRDDTSEKLVEKVLGYKPVRVLDPTLIYDFPLYKDKFTINLSKINYILMYHCDKLPKELIKRILKHCKKKNIRIYGAGEYARYYSEITINLSPFQWVEMFRNALFVFTGTFHGVVFSLMTERNFAAILTRNNPSRYIKVHSLLEQFGLSDRIIDENNFLNFEQFFKKNIRYTNFNIKKEVVRNASLHFIKDAIG